MALPNNLGLVMVFFAGLIAGNDEKSVNEVVFINIVNAGLSV